jgi:hypothetical protein
MVKMDVVNVVVVVVKKESAVASSFVPPPFDAGFIIITRRSLKR